MNFAPKTHQPQNCCTLDTQPLCLSVYVCECTTTGVESCWTAGKSVGWLQLLANDLHNIAPSPIRSVSEFDTLVGVKRTWAHTLFGWEGGAIVHLFKVWFKFSSKWIMGKHTLLANGWAKGLFTFLNSWFIASVVGKRWKYQYKF